MQAMEVELRFAAKSHMAPKLAHYRQPTCLSARAEYTESDGLSFSQAFCARSEKPQLMGKGGVEMTPLLGPSRDQPAKSVLSVPA